MRRDDLPVLLFGVVMGGAVVCGILLEIARNSCIPPATAAEFGCLEFWANRYQGAWSTIIATSGTLAAAGIAWVAVQRQIRQSERHGILMQWQATNELINRMHADLDRLNSARVDLAAACQYLSDTQLRSQPWIDGVRETAYGLRQIINAADAFPSPWEAGATQTRTELISLYRKFGMDILNCFSANQRVVHKNQGAEAEALIAGEKMQTAAKDFPLICARFAQVATNELSVWQGRADALRNRLG